MAQAVTKAVRHTQDRINHIEKQQAIENKELIIDLKKQVAELQKDNASFKEQAINLE